MNNDYSNNTFSPSNAPQTPSQPAPQPETPRPLERQKPSIIRRVLTGLVLLVLLAGVGAGIWYWQQQQIKDLKATQDTLQKQLANATQQKAEAKNVKPAQTPANPTLVAVQADVVTGDYNFDAAGKNHGVEVIYLPGKSTEVWVEYGTKVDALTSSTAKVKSTGAGVAGEYVKQGLSLDKVTSNTQTFWRAAGIVDGKTVYGGIASFYPAK